jgi:hypothetical protein
MTSSLLHTYPKAEPVGKFHRTTAPAFIFLLLFPSFSAPLLLTPVYWEGSNLPPLSSLPSIGDSVDSTGFITPLCPAHLSCLSPSSLSLSLGASNVVVVELMIHDSLYRVTGGVLLNWRRQSMPSWLIQILVFIECEGRARLAIIDSRSNL